MKQIEETFMQNGLYTTCRELLRNLKQGRINEGKFIELSREVFDVYEKQMKGERK